jgi:hypothetical protein
MLKLKGILWDDFLIIIYDALQGNTAHSRFHAILSFLCTEINICGHISVNYMCVRNGAGKL